MAKNEHFPYKNRKIFLYSAHEFNVAFMLQTLGIFEPHIPPYASYISFELHKINDDYGFKVIGIFVEFFNFFLFLDLLPELFIS